MIPLPALIAALALIAPQDPVAAPAGFTQDTSSRIYRPAAGQPAPPAIEPNDNRTPAGRLRDGVLTLHLVARQGVWYPEGPGTLGLLVAAWGEEGKPLQNPGPLIRVPAGTTVHVRVRNALQKPLVLVGLGEHRGIAGLGGTLTTGGDSVLVPIGATADLRFEASTPGTYFYMARTHTLTRWMNRDNDDSELNGAIVVDPRSATGPPRDRVLLVSHWHELDPTSVNGLARVTFAINGRSWPATERMRLTQGDTVHWRWINATNFDHPLHLHGFYFRIDARGDGVVDTVYTPDRRQLAVTESLAEGGTLMMTWAPTRPENWILHCHILIHMSPLVSLRTFRGVTASGPDGAMDEHVMAGMVLGIQVAPRGRTVAAPGTPRRLRLLVRSRPAPGGADPLAYAYVLDGSPAAARPDSFPAPGPTLVLERGQPVAITIVNQSARPTAIHWHGIELESFPDGVPGWSGAGTVRYPSIRPGDSLVVHFTPPRAGTFMYHSHFDEMQQISAGLYGAIVVLEPGRTFDAEQDRVLVFGDSRPDVNVVSGPFPRVFLNGQDQPDTMRLTAGRTYRFRLINIRGNYPVTLQLTDGDSLARWTPLARDGADLPPARRQPAAAALRFGPGEIRDFEVTPRAGGTYALHILSTRGWRPATQPPVVVPINLR